MSSSTIFSASTRRTEKKSRRRSESVAAIERVSRDRREPIADYNQDHDVATLICTELSRAILSEPNINLGKFFKSVNDSRRDINKSDTTVLVTAAVLADIGNKTMSDALLAKSRTLTKMYERMNLVSEDVRGMFVTMLFALSPDFVAMIETVIKVAIERSSARGTAKKDDDPLTTALARLTIDKTISPTELRKASSFDRDRALSFEPESRRTSIQKTPISLIDSKDFYTIKEQSQKERHKITESDLLSYNARRRSGESMEFNDVFRTAAEPVSVEVGRSSRRPSDRRGLGYRKQSSPPSSYMSAMNKILGSHNTKSVDLNTGDVSYRRPVVQDFLDSASVSTSVYNAPPDVRSEYDSTPNTSFARKPLPTEYYLPSEVAYSPEANKAVPARKDSFEDLLMRNGFS